MVREEGHNTVLANKVDGGGETVLLEGTKEGVRAGRGFLLLWFQLFGDELHQEGRDSPGIILWTDVGV